MGKYDQFLVGISTQPVSGTPKAKSGKYDQFLEGVSASPTEELQDTPTAFERFGGALPTAGAVLGGLAGGTAGTVFGMGVGGAPGMIGGATLGGAAGESARQLIGRAMGEKVPSSSAEAAKSIGREAAISGAGEAAGGVVGRAAGAAYKAFPKIAAGLSGTPAVNIARAQQRGFKVFAPGVSRGVAGADQGAIEKELMGRYFSPEEIAKIDLGDAGFANDTVRNAYLKYLTKNPLTDKEALAVRKVSGTVRAADTVRGIKKNVALDKSFQNAREVIAKSFPGYSNALTRTEKAITASQLRKPLRVNKTNPDQLSGLTSTIGPVAGGIIGSASGNVLPLLAGLLGASPLGMGLAGATMGQVKRSIPKLARRAIQRGGFQSLAQALGEQ